MASTQRFPKGQGGSRYRLASLSFTFILISFQQDTLETDLQTLQNIYNGPKNPTLQQLLTCVRSLIRPTPAQKDLLSEAGKLTKLVLVMPATNATSERTFSALMYIRTYLNT